MQEWYRTHHYWESTERNVIPTYQLGVNEERLADNDNRIVDYRKTTNYAYQIAMATILYPQDLERNRELTDELYLQTVMVFQTVTDFAQRGLKEQQGKMTMDRLTGKNYEELPTAKRVIELAGDAYKMSQEYLSRIHSNHSIFKEGLAKIGVAVANTAYFLKEAYQIQLMNRAHGRYSSE